MCPGTRLANLRLFIRRKREYQHEQQGGCEPAWQQTAGVCFRLNYFVHGSSECFSKVFFIVG
jgi:hypothetical protein